MIDNAKLLTAVTASGLSNIDIPMIPEKKKWDIQIEGCYDLIYPYIHIDYPTREEVQRWIAIHNANPHNGGVSIIDFITKIGITKTGTKYKSGSKINGIGYGL